MTPYSQPYYISPYSSCHCTWTVCQCRRSFQPTYVSFEIDRFPTKVSSNKQRMEALQLRVKVPAKRVRLRTPSVRPSLQALSKRIR
jgi:hypothetical protein